MRKAASVLSVGLFFFSVSAWSQTNSCDLTLDGRVDSADVQAAINMSLGISPCSAKIAGPNVCNVIVVQRVVNASLGGACLTSTGLHTVDLTWIPSTSTGVTGYKVFRSTTSGGPYTLLSTLGLASSYTDTTVQSGVTYFYVVTAVDSTNNSSPNSGQAQAVIPVP